MIKFVKQGEKECVLACIAMVTEQRLESLKALYYEYKKATVIETGGVSLFDEVYLLERLGYNPIVQNTFTSCLHDNRVYLVTVPSRTGQGFHRIVIDYMFFQPDIKIYDPQGEGFPIDYTDFEEVRYVFSEVTEIPFKLEYCYLLRDKNVQA